MEVISAEASPGEIEEKATVDFKWCRRDSTGVVEANGESEEMALARFLISFPFASGVFVI